MAYAPFLTTHPRTTTSLSNADRDRRTVDLLAGDHRTNQNEAVELNLPLARYLASKYLNRGIPYDDLLQVAYVGLIKAVHGFREDKATSFAAYAIPTIRGELRRHFRDAGWTIRPPRRLQELQAKVRRAEVELTQGLQRSPTTEEIAEHLDAEVDEVREASSVDGCFTPYSLDVTARGDGADTTHEPGSADPAFASAEARLVLQPALSALDSRDRRMLDLRFGQGLTQGEIGRAIGLSQMQVSRVLSRILRDLRVAIDGEAA